ncbi:MAG: hypothetical protein DRH30_10440 [Deltaproteobacteria bacterium]|nr:MAG: hypothetical protein DRH30_10440 [Deltaproteobacteria bacterium]
MKMKKEEVIGTRARKAIYAYRLAVAYRERVLDKWIPRDEELRKLDSFHRTRVALESDCYRFERLCECASYVLLRVLRDEPDVDINLYDINLFKKCRDRSFLRAVNALNDVAHMWPVKP